MKFNLIDYGWSQCPCGSGALKTPDDYARGICDACDLIKNGTKPLSEAQVSWSKHLARLSPADASTFRTEANAYDHDIYDRD